MLVHGLQPESNDAANLPLPRRRPSATNASVHMGRPTGTRAEANTTN